MPKLEYFVVAESKSVDQETNKVSLFNILEEVRVAKFPVKISFLAASSWIIEPDDYNKAFQATLKIKSPTEEKEFRANFKPSTTRHRLFQNIINMPLEKSGNVEFELSLNEEHMASHLVMVFGLPSETLQ